MNLRIKLRKNQSTLPREKLSPDLHSLEILGETIEKLPDLNHLINCRYLLLVCPELSALPALPPQVEILKIKGGHFKWNQTLPPIKTLSIQGTQASSSGLIELELPQTLETLDLSNNKLTAIPESLFKLGQLHRLSMDQNQLCGLDKRLIEMKGLNHLSLDSNPLSEEDKQMLFDAFGIWF